MDNRRNRRESWLACTAFADEEMLHYQKTNGKFRCKRIVMTERKASLDLITWNDGLQKRHTCFLDVPRQASIVAEASPLFTTRNHVA